MQLLYEYMVHRVINMPNLILSYMFEKADQVSSSSKKDKESFNCTIKGGRVKLRFLHAKKTLYISDQDVYLFLSSFFIDCCDYNLVSF